MSNRIPLDDPAEIIAGFGSDALVKNSIGRYRFQGGNSMDRADAKARIATFAPNIVLKEKCGPRQ